MSTTTIHLTYFLSFCPYQHVNIMNVKIRTKLYIWTNTFILYVRVHAQSTFIHQNTIFRDKYISFETLILLSCMYEYMRSLHLSIKIQYLETNTSVLRHWSVTISTIFPSNELLLSCNNVRARKTVQKSQSLTTNLFQIYCL